MSRPKQIDRIEALEASVSKLDTGLQAILAALQGKSATTVAPAKTEAPVTTAIDPARLADANFNNLVNATTTKALKWSKLNGESTRVWMFNGGAVRFMRANTRAARGSVLLRTIEPNGNITSSVAGLVDWTPWKGPRR